ncbi:MAG TPA: ATP-binding cassette domain-containing protein [Candidatus Dormibacteraeota bacterium]|nr:ATP-binding cassette domain-containing protein [Candidatus Dormibacteraeota bacterium]
MRTMNLAVETFGITKRFGDFTAVDHLNLKIKHEVFGLLGPNGAGKTTLQRMLVTVLTPTEGTATVAGADILREADKVRERIGVVTQASTLDVELTALQNMNLYGMYYGIPRKERLEKINELLKVVGLADRAKIRVAGYSGGMKRRLEIVRALVSDPQILFLDEPTTGLDPQARAAVLEYVQRIHKDHGITLVITTHYLDEAENLCDRLAIVDHGKIVAEGTPTELKRKISGGDIVEADFSSLPDNALKALEKADFVLGVKKRDGGLTILVKNGAEAVPKIVSLIDSNGGKLRTITLRELTLDDVFLEVTGRSLRE